MNKVVKTFLENLGVSPYEIEKKIDTKIYSCKEINSIVDSFGIYKEGVNTFISIDKIIGYNHFNRCKNASNLFLNLEAFFDDDEYDKSLYPLFVTQKSSYLTRSSGMLKLSSENVMQSLANSFILEPICISEVEENKYIISTNGLHRFHVIKAHYLKELFELQNDEEILTLNEKYTIFVQMQKLDYLKTYCHYLLSLIYKENDVFLMNDYDKNYEITGNSKLTLDDKTFILSDKQLLNLVFINLNKLNDFDLNMIKYRYENTLSFALFIEEYYPFLLKQERSKNLWNLKK